MERSVRGRLTALFTKRPEPGRVKTRLVPFLSPEEAASLAEAMLADGVERCQAGPFETCLVVAPAEAVAWARARFPGLAVEPQEGAELGQRLAHFARRAFRELGARTLVIVGSDQPLVPLERLVEAHAALEAGVDVVLGPDAGGGYYLIGLAAPCDALFTEVRMSSAGMAEATAALAHARGLRLERLAPHDDVDTPADLRRLAVELAGSDSVFVRHTRAQLRASRPDLSAPAP